MDWRIRALRMRPVGFFQKLSAGADSAEITPGIASDLRPFGPLAQRMRIPYAGSPLTPRGTPIAQLSPMSRRAVLLTLTLGALACGVSRAEETGAKAQPADESCTTCHSGLSPQLREPVRLQKSGAVHAA